MIKPISHCVWARVALLSVLLATLWGASGCCGIQQPVTGPVARTVTVAVEPSAPPTVAPTQTAAPAPSATLTAVPSATMTAAPSATLTLFPSITPSSAPSARPTASLTATRVPTPRPTPVCRVAVDPVLEVKTSLNQLGCPLGSAQVVWAAWQPFEHGYMLWRSDTNQVTVFYDDGTQQTLPDQWNEQAYTVGAPPPGRVAPVRGFGWVWVTRPEVRSRLGWGLVEEKGFCARIQSFEQGYVLRSVGGPCSDQLNRADEPSFAPVHVEVVGGRWSKH